MSEALAMVAEEIFARRFSGAQPGANLGLDAGVYCDVILDVVCDPKPLGLEPHFRFLRAYYENPAASSPLRDVINQENPDLSYYGSAWLLLRWVLDHYAGGDEARLLKAITAEPVRTGTANLEHNVGQPFASLLPNWIAAVLTDDLPGFVSPDSTIAVTSWNTRDIFDALNEAWPETYPSPFPMVFHLLTEEWPMVVNGVRGGTGITASLHTGGGASQVVELVGYSSRRPHSDLRLMLTRIR